MSLSFLKKLGQGIQKGIGIAGPFLPMFVPEKYRGATEKTVDVLEQVAQHVIQAEAIGQALKAPGAEKLKAATPMTHAALLASRMFAGKKIADPMLALRGSQKIADGIADWMNAIDESEAPEVPQ